MEKQNMHGKINYQLLQFKRRLVLTIFGSKLFSFPFIYRIRNYFYRNFFSIGINPTIEHNVWIQSTHGLHGTISIGKNVLLAKNTIIDFSGNVEIEDNVLLSEGSIIISHIHKLPHHRSVKNKTLVLPTKVKLKKGCWIGTKAIILPQVKEIGENAVIAAGSVVTKTVLPNTIVGGNPAKILRNKNSNWG